MYQEMIREKIALQGKIGADPRHVEAYMRLGHPTLDGLSPEQFNMEVAIGLECIGSDGLNNAESLAVSYGF